MICDVEHLFMYFLAVCMSSFKKGLFKSSAFFKLDCLYFCYWNESFLYFGYLFYSSDKWFASLSPITNEKIAFCLLIVYLGMQKLFNLMSHLFIFTFVDVLLVSYVKKSLPKLSQGVFTLSSSRRFMASGLVFKSLIHFELILVRVII